MTNQTKTHLITLLADEVILRNSLYLTHGATHYLYTLSMERSLLYQKQIESLKEETK